MSESRYTIPAEAAQRARVIVPQVGSTFAGRFRLRRSILLGRIGAAFEALDLQLQRLVLLKFLRADELAAYEKHAQRLSEWPNASLITILERGVHDRCEYLVLEHLDGVTLEDVHQRTRPLGRSEAAHVLAAVLRVMEAFRSANVQYCPVVGDGVLVTADGIVKLLDLGFSHSQLDGDGEFDWTSLVGEHRDQISQSRHALQPLAVVMDDEETSSGSKITQLDEMAVGADLLALVAPWFASTREARVFRTRRGVKVALAASITLNAALLTNLAIVHWPRPAPPQQIADPSEPSDQQHQNRPAERKPFPRFEELAPPNRFSLYADISRGEIFDTKSPKVRGRDFDEFADLRLKYIRLHQCHHIQDLDVAYIVHLFPQLVELVLYEASITNQSIETVATLKDLNRIDVTRTKIDDLSALRNCDTLRSLGAGGTEIDDDDLRALSNLELETLSLGHCQHITADGIMSLVGSRRRLRRLRVDKTPLTEVDLLRIAAFFDHEREEGDLIKIYR